MRILRLVAFYLVGMFCLPFALIGFLSALIVGGWRQGFEWAGRMAGWVQS